MRADVAGEVGQNLAPHIIEADTDLIHHVHHVGAGLTDDVDGDAGVAKGTDKAALLGVPNIDGGDVADVHGLAVTDRHDALEDFLG